MSESRDQQEGSTIEVGVQIRNLRELRGLSQTALAEDSGISRNTLSLIERGRTSPTVSTLKSLARALAVDINAFFQPLEETRVVFTKAGQRQSLRLDQGLLYDLGVGMYEYLVTPLVLELDPGARSGPALSHEGQDFVFCLSGELLYAINGRGYILEPGDSLVFDGRLPHRFSNTGPAKASVLIVLSHPQDSAQYIGGHFPNEDLA